MPAPTIFPSLCLTAMGRRHCGSALEAGSVKLNTDQDWDASLVGAVWRKARLASQLVEINPGNELYGGENALSSLLQHVPSLLFFRRSSQR